MLRLFAGVIVLATLVYFADWRAVALAVSHLSVSLLIALGLVSFLLIFVSALKWKLFVDSFGTAVSVWRLSELYLVGYFVNQFLPSQVGGDVVRSWYVGKSVGQHAAAAATILERYTGLVAMVMLALSFMWWSNLVTWQVKGIVLLVAVGLIGGTVVALSPMLLALVLKLPGGGQIARHLSKIQAGLQLARENRALLGRAMGFSLLYHTLTVANTLVCAAGVGWLDPPVLDLFVVLPLILLVGALPLSPSGLGIQEGAFFFFLHGVGATPAQALGIALILRVKLFVLALLGWVVWLRRAPIVGPGQPLAVGER